MIRKFRTKINSLHTPSKSVALPPLIIILLIICLLLPAACTPTRPVFFKIGIIAPFEGLYRRTGYTALLAMRSALAEYPAPQVGDMSVELLPLAQNDNHLPDSARRTAQKMLLDQSVQAVIGPFSPATVEAVGQVFESAQLTWVVPFAVNPELIQAIATEAQSQGTQRLILAGWTPGWPVWSEDEWSNLLGMAVTILAQDGSLEETLQADDAVLWLGEPDGGAAFFAELRPIGPETPFWMGPQGGDPTFFGRTLVGGPVYWATWGDDGYEEWQTTHEPATPLSYLVYRATQYAISQALADEQFVISDSWEVQFYQIAQDGQSSRYNE